jgi:hypothetical protein
MISAEQIPEQVMDELQRAHGFYISPQALASALSVWPGATYARWRHYGQDDRLVLPVASAPFDELSQSAIDQAREVAETPAPEDRDWDVVDSVVPAPQMKKDRE